MLENYTFDEIKHEYFKRLYQMKKSVKKDTCRGCKYYKTTTGLAKEYKVKRKSLPVVFNSYCSFNCVTIEEVIKKTLFYGIKTSACENKENII